MTIIKKRLSILFSKEEFDNFQKLHKNFVRICDFINSYQQTDIEIEEFYTELIENYSNNNIIDLQEFLSSYEIDFQFI